MKKIIAVIMVLFMIFGTFTSCGSKGDTKNNPTTGGQTVDQTPSKDTPKEQEPGTELSTFMSNYVDSKTKVWDAMSKQFEAEQNLGFAMGSLAFAFVDLAIVEVSFFDTLTVKNGDSFKGTLMFTNIEAWKKYNGNIVEFGYDYTYTEDKNQNLNGDHEVANGKFNMKDGTLLYEKSTERGGKKINRYIIEVTRNSDTSYSSQIYFLNLDDKDGNEKNTASGYHTWFEGQNIVSIITEKEISDINLAYNSIYGKKNIKPEEMAAGLKAISKVSFIDGKAAYEEVK